MRSSLFYLAALITVVVMVAIALSPGLAAQRALNEQLDVVEARGYVVSDEDLSRFTDIAGVSHVIISTGALIRARINATRIQTPGQLSGAGSFVSIPPPIANLFAGREVRVSVTAKRASVDPSNEFSVGYIIPHGPQSPWEAFKPLEKMTEHSFIYTPPDMKSDRGSLIAIWPDSAGGLGAIEVLNIRIELTETLPG